MTIRAIKGHGTGNDFIIVPPADRDFTAAEVTLLCDRHFGFGADGLIRIVPTVNAADEFVRSQSGAAEWFMDYRNADGSLAEMCGNGVRVFVHALIAEGLAQLDAYLAGLGLTTGWLVIFDQREGLAPMSERTRR